MYEQEEEKKDKIDNIVNLIKTMNNTYTHLIKKMVDQKVLSFLSTFKDTDTLITEQDKKKLFQKFAGYREHLKKLFKEYQSGPKMYKSNKDAIEKIQNLRETQKCFEENGQGIRFSSYYGQEVYIDMYTVRNGSRKTNALHRKLQKPGLMIYFEIKHRNKNKENQLELTMREVKDMYFELLRTYQNNLRKCERCGEVLKYCDRDNTFLPPTELVFGKEGTIRQCYHESCLEQKEMQT